MFGNFILKSALSMYGLEVTGSAAVFGGLLSAASFLPLCCRPLVESWQTERTSLGPELLIRERTDHADSTIVTLPEEMRSDVIVMEITFGSGPTVVKAVIISLLDDGWKVVNDGY